MKSFVHLHNHSCFSVLDGDIRPENICKCLKEQDMDTFALTDHGAMGGLIKFSEEFKKENMKVILGLEAYITNDLPNDENPGKDNYHLTLLAKNNIGLKNLFKALYYANMNSFYYKPRIPKSILKNFSEGVIALSGCLGGEIGDFWTQLMPEDEGKTISLVEEYASIFDDYYLEVQANRLPEQDSLNEVLVHLGNKKGIPVVLTNDCHFLSPEEKMAHNLLICTGRNMLLKDYERNPYYGPWYYVTSSEYMKETAERIGCCESYDNSYRIGEMCEAEIDFSQKRYPIWRK